MKSEEQIDRDRLAKMAYDRAREKWGRAWGKLTAETREAFVCRELIAIQQTQDVNIEERLTLRWANRISRRALLITRTARATDV